LTPDLIEDGLKVVGEIEAAVAAVPVKVTIKLAADERLVGETLQRDRLWAAQTPQIFSFNVITKAYENLAAEVTDDATAVERLGHKVQLYMGDWSDADVATHAIIDALCGAADLGDIGTLFPSQEPEYKDISSLVLLGKTSELLKAKGFRIVNIDVTIIAQNPKLSLFIPEMRKRLSQALGVESTQVTIKATTTDGLGFIGRGEGIAAQSVALITTIS
jgi:2-C-methyl-D-erythritol 2,4-cyclodiphosphate synthase